MVMDFNNGIINYKNEKNPSLPQEIRSVTQIEISECTITEDFMENLFSMFDIEKVYSVDSHLTLKLSDNSMDENTRDSIFSWLISLYQNYGCILDELILNKCNLQPNQIDALRNVARFVYISN